MNNTPSQPVRHFLLLSFLEGISADQISPCVDQFRALTKEIPGISGFEHGSYASPENLNRGLTYSFLLTFESLQARDAYLPHPAHQAFARTALGPLIKEIIVFDYVAQG